MNKVGKGSGNVPSEDGKNTRIPRRDGARGKRSGEGLSQELYATLDEWYIKEFCQKTKDNLHEVLKKYFPLKMLKEKGETMAKKAAHVEWNDTTGSLKKFVQNHLHPGDSLKSWTEKELSKFASKVEEITLLKTSKRTLALFHFFLGLDECPPFQHGKELLAKNMFPMLLFRSVSVGGSISQYVRQIKPPSSSSSSSSHQSNFVVHIGDDDENLVPLEAEAAEGMTTLGSKRRRTGMDVASVEKRPCVQQETTKDTTTSPVGAATTVTNRSHRADEVIKRLELKTMSDTVDALLKWKQDMQEKLDEDEERIKHLKAALATAQSEIRSLKKQLQDYKDVKEKLTSDIAKLKQEQSGVNAKVDSELVAMNPRLDKIFSLLEARF